jgi:hypothetical protein
MRVPRFSFLREVCLRAGLALRSGRSVTRGPRQAEQRRTYFFFAGVFFAAGFFAAVFLAAAFGAAFFAVAAFFVEAAAFFGVAFFAGAAFLAVAAFFADAAVFLAAVFAAAFFGAAFFAAGFFATAIFVLLREMVVIFKRIVSDSVQGLKQSCSRQLHRKCNRQHNFYQASARSFSKKTSAHFSQ